MRDILEEIAEKKITEDEAYRIYDETIDKHDASEIEREPMEELGMDEYERTAFLHGISLSILADWRYHGWPDCCDECGAKINYKDYGWMIIHDKLVGIDCHE